MFAIRWIEYDLHGWDALEEYLMGENKDVNVKIWGRAECPECQKIKDLFDKQGYEYNDIDSLISSNTPNVEAMTQLSFQDMRLPLVMIADEWVDPKEIIKNFADRVA